MQVWTLDIISLKYPFTELPSALDGKPISVAIGHFDGVHRGHQNVIRRAVDAAHRSGHLSAVMTFDPHPKEVLGQGDHYFNCLTPLADKQMLFEALGVDVMLVVSFDTTFAAILPEQFIDEVLRPLHAKQVVVGFDFTFGYRGLGKPELLESAGKPDIEVEIVEALCEKGVKVSSTSVRAALAEGNVEDALLLLGRPYRVAGTVVHGDKRGRTIGYPTANVSVNDRYVLPRLGVYAITAEWNGKPYYGVVNLGKKPTFKEPGGETTLEAHLFDFNQDIYGDELTIRFHSFIRSERKFGSVTELIEQIHKDSDTAKKLFNLNA